MCDLAEQVVPASMLVAVTHAGLWNTLHPDSHEVILADDERMSDSNGAAYIQWLSDALGCALTSPMLRSVVVGSWCFPQPSAGNPSIHLTHECAHRLS